MVHVVLSDNKRVLHHVYGDLPTGWTHDTVPMTGLLPGGGTAKPADVRAAIGPDGRPHLAFVHYQVTGNGPLLYGRPAP